MIFVLNPQASDPEIQDLRVRIEELGFVVDQMTTMGRVAFGLSGDLDATRLESVKRLRAHPAVADVISTIRSYRLVARSADAQRSVVEVAGVPIGGHEVALIAGPCSVESREQLMTVAQSVSRAGARLLRGGAFKPSTSPYSFQGLGQHGLELLAEAKSRFGLGIVTEVMDVRQVESMGKVADLFQIGTRNMFNYDLLREVGRAKTPVLLKRGFSAKYEEWLLAAETIAAQGNESIILCERGIRTFEPYTRNTLDLAAIPAIHELSRLPIIVDPSQGTGRRELVGPMSQASIAAGADGLLIEVHPNPIEALKDGSQSISCDDWAELVPNLKRVADAVGRSIGSETRVR